MFNLKQIAQEFRRTQLTQAERAWWRAGFAPCTPSEAEVAAQFRLAGAEQAVRESEASEQSRKLFAILNLK